MGIYRSSRLQIFFKIGVLKNFAIFAGKHLCLSLFLIKLREASAQVFPVNIAKFFRAGFLKEYLRWLLLDMVHKVSNIQNL